MNYYNLDQSTCNLLRMNGSLGESERFIISGAIAISEGDRLIFGPMRLGQPVMGYFYDEEDQPLMLINHTNIEILHTFEEGMVMASICAPEAATVRLQLTLLEKDAFYIYINEEIHPQEITAFGNPLKGRKVLTIGDSLCAAAKDEKSDGLRGWARRIRDHFEAEVTNAGIGGTALSDCRMAREKATIWHQIFKQIIRFEEPEYDYILLEGGANDAWDKAPIGVISDSFDPASFDLTTYAGGLEMAIYTAVKNYGDTAALGYMSIYKTPHFFRTLFSGPYFEVGKAICEKWGIPYLDTYNDLEFDTIQYTVDGIHANGEGYDFMAPFIHSFMLKLRPISQEIYEEIHS